MTSLPTTTNYSNPYEKIRQGGNKIARLQFPLDMGRYYIAFEFAKYSSSYNSGASDLANLPGVPTVVNGAVGAINSGLALTGSSIQMPTITSKAPQATYGIGSINAAIALPMPTNLVDDQQLDYNAQNLLNVVGQAVSSVSGTTINSVINAGTAVEKFQSMYTGQTVNPFLAMMFNGPRFKTHQFGWRFSPKNAEETDAIVKIVNTFKSKSLPEQWAGGTLFQYPDVCMISLYPENARNRMYKFKPAVITQTSIHYAPSGTPSFFAGTNGPAEIELKLQLSEISIWTHGDVADYSTTNTGAGR